MELPGFGRAPQLKLKVGRSLPGAGNFTIVGESPLKSPTPSQLNTYTDMRIPVQTGDVIGYYVATMAADYRAAGTHWYVITSGDQAPGTTFSSAPFTNQLDISAVLEPDADNDGFGDETQDGCPSDAAVQGPCADTSSPDTTITKMPKDKTKKKQATFEFNSSESGSTFECSVDGGAFSACASPETVKVKKGKHTFAVRASDAAGNLDASPASDDWKVKKKKK